MLRTVERLHGNDSSSLPVQGTVPRELAGALLQAYPHPGLNSRRHGDSRPLAISGIRFRDGQVSWYLASENDRPPCPFVGPVAAIEARLAPLATSDAATAAWPVRDPGTGHWHTVVTAPDRGYAEHLVVRDGGAVVRSRRFPLDGAPLMHADAVTSRYVVVMDLPVTYRRAAAMVGVRSPYAWQSGRPARIGLLPRHGDGDLRWFEVDPGYTFRTVNAYDEGDRVVVDVLWHEGAPEPGPAPVVRWTLDLHTGTACARSLTGEVRVAVTDPATAGSRHRFVHTAAGSTIARHDLETGRVEVHDLGAGRRAGQPVLVPGRAGGGWVMAFVEDVAHRSTTVVVLDAFDVAGPPVAEIPLPVAVPTSSRATWAQAGSVMLREVR